MQHRRPLTPEARRRLRKIAEEGDESMNSASILDDEILTIDGNVMFGGEANMSAHPADGRDGTVWAVLVGDPDGAAPLTPDQARRYAADLLVAADHAEFGPGEWRSDSWHLDPEP